MTTTDTTQSFLEKFKFGIEKMKTEVTKGFGGLFVSAIKDGALNKRQKELIALGIAVAQCCEPCVVLHVQRCLETGLTAPEIIDAAGVAVMMQGGPAYTHVPVVIETLEALAGT